APRARIRARRPRRFLLAPHALARLAGRRRARAGRAPLRGTRPAGAPRARGGARGGDVRAAPRGDRSASPNGVRTRLAVPARADRSRVRACDGPRAPLQARPLPSRGARGARDRGRRASRSGRPRRDRALLRERLPRDVVPGADARDGAIRRHPSRPRARLRRGRARLVAEVARRRARERRDAPRGAGQRPRDGGVCNPLPHPSRRRHRDDLAQRPGRQPRGDPGLREARLRARRRLCRGRAVERGRARFGRVSVSSPDVCVVGAGAAGLACAATLRRAGAEVVVLERDEIGAAWRARYDCLHLHTVRWLSGLPGYGIPRSYGKWPSRDGVVDYLRRYAGRNQLDVRPGNRVERIDRIPEGWAVDAGGERLVARRVIVATGYSNVPFLPDWPGTFGGELVHSSDYRRGDLY